MWIDKNRFSQKSQYLIKKVKKQTGDKTVLNFRTKDNLYHLAIIRLP